MSDEEPGRELTSLGAQPSSHDPVVLKNRVPTRASSNVRSVPNVVDIWVTGLGAVTPLGTDLPSTWAAMQSGENGISAVDRDWATDLPVRIAAQLTADPAEL